MGIDPVTHTPRLDLLDLSTILNSSLYTNNSQSQINNFSRLLGAGVQPLINPELIRLATSLLSSQRRNQDHFLMHQQNTHTNLNHQSLIQIENPTVQDLTNTCLDDSTPCVQLNQDQAHQYDTVQRFSDTDLAGFGFQVNYEWPQNDGSGLSALSTEDYANYGYYGSGQCVVDPFPSSEASTFQSNSGNNFSFQSAVVSNMSTPSSSSTPLHSNSAYNVNSSSTTEDERESYCSNMLKFETIQDILDVNDYL